VQPICAQELRTALATALAPGVAGIAQPALQSHTIYRVDQGGVADLDLGRGDCDRYLAVTNLPGAPDAARARFLVREASPTAPAGPGGNVVVAALTPAGASPPPAAGNPTVRNSDTAAPPAAPPPGPARVQVRLRSLRIGERRPDGDSWDSINGPVPDPYVVVYRGSELVGRTRVIEDRYQAQMELLIREPIARVDGVALRFDVVDEDAAFDDPIGSAVIPTLSLPTRAGEVPLPLLLPNERRPSGTLLLWVEPETARALSRAAPAP
jgi:hypothetical protein